MPTTQNRNEKKGRNLDMQNNTSYTNAIHENEQNTEVHSMTHDNNRTNNHSAQNGRNGGNMNYRNHIQYRISYIDGTGTLFLYSKDSESAKKPLAFDIPEEHWNELEKQLCKFTALLYHTTEDCVAVKRYGRLNGKKCAPFDGCRHYDDEFRIALKISHISDYEGVYDTVCFDVEEDSVYLCFYKGEDYVHCFVPKDATLSDLGLDEEQLLAASESLIRAANPNKEIVCEKRFRSKVYSDMSGGYTLRFITK